jgi:hypothetical protein
MVPLIDIPNHKQPEKLDTSDFVTFNFAIADKTLKKDTGCKFHHNIINHLFLAEKVKMLLFPAVTKYNFDEEFSYGYSKGLQPI